MRTVLAALHLCDDTVDRARILKRQSAPKCIPKNLVRKVANKQTLFLHQSRFQLIGTIEASSVGQLSFGVNRLVCVFGAPSSEHIVILQRETKRVDSVMTTRA